MCFTSNKLYTTNIHTRCPAITQNNEETVSFTNQIIWWPENLLTQCQMFSSGLIHKLILISNLWRVNKHMLSWFSCHIVTHITNQLTNQTTNQATIYRTINGLTNESTNLSNNSPINKQINLTEHQRKKTTTNHSVKPTNDELTKQPFSETNKEWINKPIFHWNQQRMN